MEQPAERQLSLVNLPETQEFSLPYLSLDLKEVSSHLAQATVRVTTEVTQAVLRHTVSLYRNRTETPGLKVVPTSYIEKNYGKDIASDMRKLLYRYFVIDYLHDELGARKINLANSPRLAAVDVGNNGSVFTFDISLAPPIKLREWKHFAFKPPRRKNYKDLDKQVDSFIKKHQDRSRKRSVNTIEDGDWVCFTAQMVDDEREAIVPNYTNTYWLKATGETIKHPLVDAVLGKQIGETIVTDQFPLNHQFSQHMHKEQVYALTVSAIAKGSHLAIDSLKNMFKLANKAAVHEKVIEVFSYRNELSQRRTMIEEMFHLFFSKHRYEVPKHLALRKQEEILQSIKGRPDYHAYRKDKDFLQHVATLAEQQLKEEMIIDQIAMQEKIKVDIKDMSYYLNVLGDDRSREFIYFRPTLEMAEDYPAPVQTCVLKRTCRRDKTLNYILHQLTR